jgi:hypothetical protein
VTVRGSSSDAFRAAVSPKLFLARPPGVQRGLPLAQADMGQTRRIVCAVPAFAEAQVGTHFQTSLEMFP